MNNKIKEEKWFWMMNYCRDKQIPPAQTWAWNEAESAYELKQQLKQRK